MKNFKQKPVVEDSKGRVFKAPSVSEYMATELITFRPDTEIKEVLDSLLENRISGAPVLNEDNEVVGLIDDKDCLNLLMGSEYHNHPVGKRTAASYMSNVMKTISMHDNIIDAANIFLHTKYKRLVVIDDEGRLKGQISRRDVLRAIKDLDFNIW